METSYAYSLPFIIKFYCCQASYIFYNNSCRDACYMNNTKYYKLAENNNSFFIVCGLNRVKTGKSTYINFAVGSVIAVDDSKFVG